MTPFGSLQSSFVGAGRTEFYLGRADDNVQVTRVLPFLRGATGFLFSATRSRLRRDTEFVDELTGHGLADLLMVNGVLRVIPRIIDEKR